MDHDISWFTSVLE